MRGGHGIRNMAGERDVVCPGRLGNGVERLDAQVRIDLDEVVARALVPGYHVFGIGGVQYGIAPVVNDGLPVDDAAAGDDPRAREFARSNAFAQVQHGGLSPHGADQGHAAGQVRIEVRGGHGVCVHVGEAGSEVFARAVDDVGAGRRLHARVRPDRGDPACGHDNGLSVVDALGCHRHDVHVCECVDGGWSVDRDRGLIGGAITGCDAATDCQGECEPVCTSPGRGD